MKVDKETLEKRNLIADVKKKSAESEHQISLAKQNISDAICTQGQINVNKAEELRLIFNHILLTIANQSLGVSHFILLISKAKNRNIVMRKLIEIVERF